MGILQVSKRTFYDATTCHVSRTNKCKINDYKAIFRRPLFA
ncbi:hypothetical protein T10_6892 [Trichinella papuae]|uniref:Uncharacterized protein n=1 Tax=Trichinella papuae TaxID=268474 RepID=A0A0V1LYY3_9BILA|nr:hypothetical protein T10_6892 [Trichinella papuae]